MYCLFWDAFLLNMDVKSGCCKEIYRCTPSCQLDPVGSFFSDLFPLTERCIVGLFLSLKNAACQFFLIRMFDMNIKWGSWLPNKVAGGSQSISFLNEVLHVTEPNSVTYRTCNALDLPFAWCLTGSLIIPFVSCVSRNLYSPRVNRTTQHSQITSFFSNVLFWL